MSFGYSIRLLISSFSFSFTFFSSLSLGVSDAWSSLQLFLRHPEGWRVRKKTHASSPSTTRKEKSKENDKRKTKNEKRLSRYLFILYWFSFFFFLFLYSLSLSRLLQNRIHWLLERKSFNQRMDSISKDKRWEMNEIQKTLL